MSQSVEIKNTKELSATELSQLHFQCFPRGWNSEEFQSYLENPIMHFFCAYHKEQLAGFLLLQVIEEDAEILTFCVSPNLRGQGVGQFLLKKAIANFSNNGGKEIILDVSKTNTIAIHIYRHFGFQPFAIRERYYKPFQGIQEDAVVMKLKIK